MVHEQGFHSKIDIWMNPEKIQIVYIRFGFSFLDLNILVNQWLGCNALQQFVKETLFL